MSEEYFHGAQYKGTKTSGSRMYVQPMLPVSGPPPMTMLKEVLT